MFPYRCFCRQCEDNRVLAAIDECGSYFEARKQVATENAVYKARLEDLSSADPMTRELAKGFFGGEAYLRKAV